MRRRPKFRFLLFLAVTGLITAGAAAPVALSPYAESVAKIIQFDRDILITIKQTAGAEIQRLIGYDENHYQIIADGVCVAVREHETDTVLDALRKKLRPRKYMAFVVEMNEGIKADKIGVLKGTDQYEILRIMHTDSEALNVSNQDLIDRLKEWEKKSSFNIVGAGYDWVELEFKKLPKDLQPFTEEVHDFCPDAVDQGAGSMTQLAKEIEKTGRLFLRWD